MDGPVEGPVLPCPVKDLSPPPSHPAIADGRLSEQEPFDGIVVGAPSHVECSRASGECKHKVLQVTRAGQRTECSNGRLNLVLKTKINTARDYLSTVFKRAGHFSETACGVE